MQEKMIVSSDRNLPSESGGGAIVVATPLDAIVQLEQGPIATVVLAGSYATSGELADFITEHYPTSRVEREV